MEQRYSVTQTAEILGVRASVLRYWEEELGLRINRNDQGHRYYTGYDITLLANIKELKKRGLALRAIKDVLPKLSQPVPDADGTVRLLEDDRTSTGKILEFQRILERLITQELQMKRAGEDECRSLDAAIRRRQLARKEAAASAEKNGKKKRKQKNTYR